MSILPSSASQWFISARGLLRRFAWDFAALTVVLPSLFFLLIWRLHVAPPNVTGDEATYLNEILRILHSREKIGFFSLMSDGSQPAASFYFMAGFVKAMGEDNAIRAMRTASAVLSIAALAAFYVYLRGKVALVPAVLATVLLGTNFVFINFSRSTWGTLITGPFAFALLSFFCIEYSIRKRKLWLAALAGILAGISQYGYFGSKIFPLATSIYLAYNFFRREVPRRWVLAQATLYALAALFVFLPELLYIRNHYDVYTQRANAVSIFKVYIPYYGESHFPGILWHQFTYTVRGFLFLDPSVAGEGPENARYVPLKEGPVDVGTRILFFLSLAAFPLIRKDILQPAAAFFLLLVTGQLLTILPPNYARGLFLLPFLYLLIALLFQRIWALTGWARHARWGLVVLVIPISLWNVQHYFHWGSTAELAAVRGPSFRYQDVPLWIETAKRHMAAGEPALAITNPEWDRLAGRLMIGAAGQGKGHFRDPADLAVDKDGNLYVADVGNHRIQRFDPLGQFQLQLGGLGSRPGRFNKPSGIALDAGGNLYVADTGNHRIQKFDGAGRLVAVWGKKSRLRNPLGIAVAADGDLWVSDTGNHCLLKYDQGGRLLSVYGDQGSGPSQFQEPVAVAASPAGIYVADVGNQRIQRFDIGFRLIQEIKVEWEGPDSRPSLATLADGGLLVTDPSRGRLLRFDAQGRLVGTMEGAIISAPFQKPSGVVADSRGFVYVSEEGSNRIRRFFLTDIPK